MKIATLFIILTLCSIIVLSSNNAFAEQNTSAKAMVVIDAKSERILFNKNENEKLPMASTTKIVTALTVLNNCDNINKEIKIDSRAVGISGTSIYLKKDETMTLKELLYGLMLHSGNDAATALAYYISGDINNFCELMKQTAILCGAYNSNFENPHGLDSTNHYTTALDLAKITAKALENETFREIVSTKNTRIRGSNQGSYRYLKNKNKLLSTLDGCIGVKTGYTSKAGRCLVSATEKDNFRCVCVVLNCGPMFEESQQLLNSCYNEYKYVELLPAYCILRKVQVINGVSSNVDVYTKSNYYYPLKTNEMDLIDYEYVMPNSLNAPIERDEFVGELNIYFNNHLLFSEKIYTINNVKKIGVWNNIKDIVSNW